MTKFKIGDIVQPLIRLNCFPYPGQDHSKITLNSLQAKNVIHVKVLDILTIVDVVDIFGSPHFIFLHNNMKLFTIKPDHDLNDQLVLCS